MLGMFDAKLRKRGKADTHCTTTPCKGVWRIMLNFNLILYVHWSDPRINFVFVKRFLNLTENA
jgi:hypothetical protein